ncbi:MAG: HAD hydrolase family protein [Treponema sp.]|jgi:hydroxymethylpyrimidine pyrophosphatase-like HAD family hydrolase|nr:HAD hydrolase family protein [Treponema sp.]
MTRPRPCSIRALALDLDGTTLRPDNSLSERTVRAVRACADRGIRPILCTGRAVQAAEKYRAALGAAGPHVYCNGAAVAEMPGWKMRALTLQDKESALFCAALARKTGLYFQAYLPGSPEDPRHRLVSWRGGPERDFYRGHTGMEAEIVDMEAALAEVPGCIKTMFIAAAEAQAQVRPVIAERYGGSLYLAGSLGTFLEVMNPRATKGEGLKTALEILNLDSRDVIAFGDEENDLPLFRAAGFSVAPANARDMVKAAAGLVTGSNAEDAVAVFLEGFFDLKP